MTHKNRWCSCVIVVGVFFFLGAPGRSYSEDGVSFVSKISFSGPSVSAASSRADSKGQVHFVPNTFTFWDKPRFWPTTNGPAYADIVLDTQNNFLECRGGPIALCYYSGPDEPATCELSDDGRIANCKCFVIPYGTYFVDIYSILNYGVYLKTVRKCGADGSGCSDTNSAPVCDAINDGKLIPGADMISTFSYACVPEEGIGQTNCPADPAQTAVYAGCMTAPCTKTDEDGIVNCACPTFNGRYQVGAFIEPDQCTLTEPLVWSAAYNPNEEDVNFPTPPTDGCFPDAPGGFGCPLLAGSGDPPVPIIPPPPSDVDCVQVCNEYASTANADNVELGFTCDATLCTAPPTCTIGDPLLVDAACTGLQPAGLTEIIKTETEAQCSCCASQICGCEPNEATEVAIDGLNAAQNDLGIPTQCDLNGTLCGTQ